MAHEQPLKLLDELRVRHAAAQVRFQAAQLAHQQAQQAQQAALATFQRAQQELVQAQQEFHGWNVAVSVVEREEAERREATHEKQMDLPSLPSEPEEEPSTSSLPAMDAAETPGKTELIRELLRQHPQGITATEIWNQLHERLKHRAYLYNVLKRLEKNEGLSQRRGKYAFRTTAQESRDREVLPTVQ